MDKHFSGLDGLRGLAAFMVVVHHTALKGTDIGGLSVFLFFILSGFLITGILVKLRLKIEAGRMGVWAATGSFWLQRALRIFPAYYVWLGLFLFIDHYWYHDETIVNLGWYLLYLQNFLIAFKTYAWEDFTHTWSLAVEQQYYVFFAPLVLMLASRWHRRFFVGVIAVCIVAIISLQAAGYEMVTLYPTPSTGFVFMGCGAILSVTDRNRLKPFANPLLVVAAIVLIVALASYPVAERNHIAKVPYVLLVVGSAASLSVIMAATLASPTAFAVRVLETSPMRYLGRISYALYIIHLPIALWVEDFGGLAEMSEATHIPADLIHFAIVSVVSVALASLSYVVVEKPFLDLKARLKASTTARPEVAA
ncbi:MAG: acyltransferase [Ancalomicrobiaceae bacterium]|nr:acyltransferase [Ancalomicrobiaceae bacterium]